MTSPQSIEPAHVMAARLIAALIGEQPSQLFEAEASMIRVEMRDLGVNEWDIIRHLAYWGVAAYLHSVRTLCDARGIDPAVLDILSAELRAGIVPG